MTTPEQHAAAPSRPWWRRVSTDLLIGVTLLAGAVVARTAWTVSESGLAALAGG